MVSCWYLYQTCHDTSVHWLVVGAKHLYQFRVQQSTINNQQSTNNKIHNCYLIEKTFGILVVGEVNG
ncbi:hypothetical protein CEN46_06100 [Fischerella thermalis CCMEE 5318]|uniref:Uncharacterized protein n=1 Tax=Fischerella thermalis CCMEE 5318 TaxID=2019666 RepID=A0A2N6LKF2_9CYAN|nr:hypothetical protein CEN46_06100 [Fischerella thermalis CCMEE 5318]